MSEHILDLSDSRHISLYNFTIDVPWIDPITANAALYWTVSSLMWKPSLFG